MGAEGRISYLPTEGLTYDPEDGTYWEPALLDGELRRVFEVCHGCRLCFKYCDTFPSLFKLLDERYEGDVRRIEAEEIERTLDTCFQCKLCEVHCPYTPRDGHAFQLDFPRLVHRQRAVRARERGTSLVDDLLGDPDLMGTIARRWAGLVNRLNRFPPNRVIMEKLLGIHREKALPDFAAQSFEEWAREEGLIRPEPGGEVVLFHTCFVQHNDPGIGQDAIEVFRRNGVDVRCVAGLRCCGMPAWEHGDLEELRARAREDLRLLLPYVERGAKVVVLNPTCSMTMRREWPTLLAREDREAAGRLAAAVMDAGEYLWTLVEAGRFNTDFQSVPEGPVAYHAPCHLRAQSVGFKGRDLLRKIPGMRAQTVMECSGHDGTHAMKVDGYDQSIRVGKKAFEGMQGAEAKLCATDCPLAALQMRQHAGLDPLHPISILARAYRKDGFGRKTP